MPYNIGFCKFCFFKVCNLFFQFRILGLKI